MPSQIPLPLENAPSLTRADFIVSNGNRDALAFIESWPAWAVGTAAIYGPAASGKTHLAEIWIAKSGAQRVAAAALSGSAFVLLRRDQPVVIEDVDSSLPNPARDTAIVELTDSATRVNPVLLTGRREPSSWDFAMPDLRSRFAAIVSFSLWEPGDELLRQLGHKLFEDRQISVPEPILDRILTISERSPAALRDFVRRADAKALAEGRPVNASLVRELLAQMPDCNDRIG